MAKSLKTTTTKDFWLHPCFKILILANKEHSYDRVKTSLPSNLIPKQIMILDTIRIKKQVEEKDLVALFDEGGNPFLQFQRRMGPLIKIGLVKKEAAQGNGGRVNVYLLDDGIDSILRGILDTMSRWRKTG